MKEIPKEPDALLLHIRDPAHIIKEAKCDHSLLKCIANDVRTTCKIFEDEKRTQIPTELIPTVTMNPLAMILDLCKSLSYIDTLGELESITNFELVM